MATFEALVFDIEDRIATIRLNRPDVGNGLSDVMVQELRRVAKLCDADPDLKAVILTANGQYFCVGGDIKAMASYGEGVGPAIKKFADDLHMAISTFARMDIPLIVAVNGMAAGGGFSLAICGDLVIAAESAAFTMAYTKAGLSPDGSSSYYLPRLVGLRRAQELMFTNRELSAVEALDWGLVNEVVPDAELQARARAMAANFVKGSKGANAMVKKLLLASFDNSLETQMELEGRGISACVASEDGQEGITAFIEKRPPQFK